MPTQTQPRKKFSVGFKGLRLKFKKSASFADYDHNEEVVKTQRQVLERSISEPAGPSPLLRGDKPKTEERMEPPLPEGVGALAFQTPVFAMMNTRVLMHRGSDIDSREEGSSNPSVEHNVEFPAPEPAITLPLPEPALALPDPTPPSAQQVKEDVEGGSVSETPLAPKDDAAARLLQLAPGVWDKERGLSSSEDSSNIVDKVSKKAEGVMAVVKPLIEDTRITYLLNAAAENIPQFMKALDAVAGVHPYIKGAVFAFQVAYSMYTKRKENDQRIVTLHIAMKDMISIVLELRDVKDAELQIEGITIKARLQTVAEQVEKDIKDCANACDTYSKKRTLVKVLQGDLWKDKLVGFAEMFTQRKKELQQALTMHTARAVDDMKSQMSEMLYIVRRVFEAPQFAPQADNQMIKHVQASGGVQAVMNDDTALRKLSSLRIANNIDTKTHAAKYTFEDLKSELAENWSEALSKNLKAFEGKFALHQRQMQEELSRLIREENNRVIDEVNKGPHDLIHHPELREIWKEMGWRRNVKARLFVLTLRDHFKEKVHNAPLVTVTGDGKDKSDTPETDEWTLQYIGIPHLQPIMEAFDDDASGYITISEVNAFTDSLPSCLNWSLQKWVAYWAIGWHLSATLYRNRILDQFAQLFAMRFQVRPENRNRAESHLEDIWQIAAEVTKAFTPAEPKENTMQRFKEYMDYEEERMRKNLEDIKYDIDALDTVYMVAGSGRIEKHIFVLVHLLLKRHIEIMQVAKTKVLHQDELSDAADTVIWVWDTIRDRHADLCALAKQKEIDVKQYLKSYAYGLFSYYDDGDLLWGYDKLSNVSEVAPSGALEPGPIESESSVLNYPLSEDWPFRCELFDIAPEQETEDDAKATLPVKAFLGEWNGFAYNDSQYPALPMLNFYFHASATDDHQIEASSILAQKGSFKIIGKCKTEEDGSISATFTLSYSANFATRHFAVKIDQDGSIMGSEGSNDNVAEHTGKLIAMRIPAHIMCHRPSPLEFSQNKIRALWKFATSYAIHEARKKLWSWSYFRARRDARLDSIRFGTQAHYAGPKPNAEEDELFRKARQAQTPDQVYFQFSLRVYEQLLMPIHYCQCDCCGKKIGGSRVICLDCKELKSWYTDMIDLCGDHACAQAGVSIARRPGIGRPHIPEHDILKFRKVMNIRDVPQSLVKAQEALRVCREHLEKVAPSRTDIAVDHPGEIVSRALVEEGGTTSFSPPSTSVKTSPLVSDSAPSAAANSDVSGELGDIKCHVCHNNVKQPFWFCIDCNEHDIKAFICDDCDKNKLLRCKHCEGLFKQSTWWYGSRPGENFMCNKCNALRVPAPAVDREKQHTYMHSLVQCKPKHVEKEEPPKQSTEERIESLEKQVKDLSGELGRAVSSLVEIQRVLSSLNSKMDTYTSPTRESFVPNGVPHQL